MKQGIVLGLSAVCVLAGCKSGKETDSAPAAATGDKNVAAVAEAKPKSGKRTIAYIQKQGDQQYFVDQAAGAREAAAKLGVEVKVSNVALDSNLAVSTLETMIAQNVDGIAVVVPDQRIGPQVIDRAKQAGIPLVASDDGISDAAGNAAPFVGFDGGAMGREVGLKAGALYKASGWKAADTRIISSSKQDLSVCQDRVNGAKKAFIEASGESGVKVVDLGTDNTPIDAQNRTAALITANRGVKHWVVWGCNDENVSGVVTALANANVEAKDVIGVGLGAYLACKDWKAGKQTGMKAALFIDGRDVGAAAVRVLSESIQNKTPLPAKTIAETHMVDATNWQNAGVKCE
ncbi:substrate-binding domain-containing protein [Pendulispora albinea]|uniref:Substrate-binding domain-containing protein n=1 Tax=Pendulispora albinea TaxID=2741071 RepID=A0ABZ2M919_9BACT